MPSLFQSFFDDIWDNTLRKRTVMFSEGLTVLGFDNNGSNSAQESSPNEKSDDSRNDFSANKPSTSEKTGSKHSVACQYGSRRGFAHGHIIDWKISTQQSQTQHNWNHYPIFHLFPKFENTTSYNILDSSSQFSEVASWQPQANRQAQLWQG